MGGLAGDEVAEPGTDDGAVVGDALEGAAGHEHAHGDAHGIGAVEALDLADEALVVEVEAAALGGQLGGQAEVLRRPRPQRGAVQLDGLVAHGEQHVPGVAAERPAAAAPGPASTTRRARSPTRSSSEMIRSTDTTKRRSDATGDSRPRSR